MTAIQVIFYAFSAIAVFSGLMVVVSRNPVRAALFLVLAFVASSGLWILLQAEFLALILVLVYVGAVMTLFLFVVMMLNAEGVITRESFVRYLPLGSVVILLVVGVIVLVVTSTHVDLVNVPVSQPADYSNVANLGLVLYTEYAFPFEVAAVLLLTAIVASISLTHRPSVNRKAQNASAQIAVQAKDRIRLIKMRSEKKNSPKKAGQ